MSSYYDDEPRRYSNVRTRPRERGEPDYVVEETYIERGNGPGPRGPPTNRGELVYRGRDDSVEDIPRDFPPPRGSAAGGGARDYRRSSYRSDYEDDRYSRRTRSVGGGRRYSDDYDDRYTDYGTAGAAGAAGYAAGRHREKERRRRRDRDYDSEYSSRSRSRSRTPPRKERRKSGIEEVLGGLGLGGVVGALSGKKDRSRSDSRSRVTGRSGRSRSRAASRRRHSSTSSSSRSRSRAGDGKKNTEKKWAQAAQAAIVAGAVEAFRSRKEPGPWTGDRGKRVATAAIGAGGIDGLLDRNPNEKSKRHLAEAVLGGLAANRLANGPRSKSRGRGTSTSPDGRSPDARPASGLRARSRSVIDRFRGRSQSRGRPQSEAGEGGGAGGALKGLAAGGALAAAGKAIYDRVRSKSRGGKKDSRSRSRSSSADSYVPSRRRPRGRRGSPQSDMGSTRQPRAAGAAGPGQSRDLASRDTNNGNGALVGAGAGAGAGALAARGGGTNEDASSDSSSTTDMEKKRKHMRGKELLTAGLATIATIHAAHGVYSSMEAHEKRHKLVAEGEMSPEEARKKQTKAWVQDAAAVGIAALGIKGAFSEWKEMNEQRYVLPSDRPIPRHQKFVADSSSLPTDAKSKRSRSGRRSAGRSASSARSVKSKSAGTRLWAWRSRTRRWPWR